MIENQVLEGGLRPRGAIKKSESNMPLFTIVTVVYNGEDHLEQAIQSVFNQTYKNIEYIIIDGGSSDGTVGIIRKYDDRLDLWISEPDKGIFHAMNKGIELANGEIIGLLNSDDFYFPNAIESVVESYIKGAKGIWYGKQIRFEDYSDFCNFRLQIPDIEKMFERPSIFHTACFVHRNVYNSIGGFKLKYKIISDYDFLLTAIEKGIQFIFIDSVLTGFRAGGKSGSAGAWLESYSMIREHPKHKASFLYITWNMLRKGLILGLLRSRRIKEYFNNKRKKETTK